MYFFGGDANEVEGGGGVGEAMSIGVALSNDGIHWGRVEGEHSSGAVLEPNEGQLFVGWPQVIQIGSDPERWRMYFHALNTKTKRYEIGIASSPDGVPARSERPLSRTPSSPKLYPSSAPARARGRA